VRDADRRPRAAQRGKGKETQERPIGEQHHIPGADARAQATAESPLFCARWAAR
jgi:hypothetical protein